MISLSPGGTIPLVGSYYQYTWALCSSEEKIKLTQIRVVRKRGLKTKTAQQNMVYFPPPSLSKSRKLLIFNHNPKAGGGSIKLLLNDLFDCRVKSHGKKITWADDIQKAEENNCYIYVNEFSATTEEDRSKGFIIGSVRDPCSQYLSLWAFGSKGDGSFLHQLKHNGKGYLYGQDAPHFSSDRDIASFNLWLRDKSVFGMMSKRFNISYYKNAPSRPVKMNYQYFKQYFNNQNKKEQVLAADCLVYVDDFQRSLLTCIQEYEKQGGYVNWNSTSLMDLVQSVRSKEQEERIRRSLRGKDNITSDPRSLHHAPCSKYFDNETKLMMENGPDSAIFKTFGYKCCASERHGGTITEPLITITNTSTKFITHPTLEPTPLLSLYVIAVVLLMAMCSVTCIVIYLRKQTKFSGKQKEVDSNEEAERVPMIQEIEKET